MRQALTASSPFNLDVLKTSCLARVIQRMLTLALLKKGVSFIRGLQQSPNNSSEKASHTLISGTPDGET